MRTVVRYRIGHSGGKSDMASGFIWNFFVRGETCTKHWKVQHNLVSIFAISHLYRRHFREPVDWD